MLTLTERYQTKAFAPKSKITSTFNVLRWDGGEFVRILDSAFRGRKKKVDGKKVYAKTKAHSLTRSKAKRYIWRRDEDAEGTEVEKLGEDLWKLRSKLLSLANLAAICIKSPPGGIKAASVGINAGLAGLEGEVEATGAKVIAAQFDCSDKEQKEVHGALTEAVNACRNEARLCRERVQKLARIEDIFGFTYDHPDTHCCSCSMQPIVGWKYHCNQ